MANEEPLGEAETKLDLDDTASGNTSASIGKSLAAVMRLVYALATLCLFGVSASLLIQISTRSINIGIQGLGALAQLLTVWMSFLVIGNLEFEDKHIEIDYFVNKLPETLQQLVSIGVSVICLIWAFGVLLSALQAVPASMDSTIPTLGIPAATLHAAPIIGMTLLAIAYLVKMKSRIENLVARVGGSLD